LQFTEQGDFVGQDLPLQAGSAVIVGKKSAKPIKQVAKISVQGEVNKPGIYIINEGKTTLTDIIQLAGGFTDKAHLPLARIYRITQPVEYVMDPRRTINETFQYSNFNS